MPEGCSRPNCKYGVEETQRRAQYPRGEKYQLEQMIKAGEPKQGSSSPWDEKIPHLDK